MNRRRFFGALTAPIAAFLAMKSGLSTPTTRLALHKDAFSMAMDPISGIKVRFATHFEALPHPMCRCIVVPISKSLAQNLERIHSRG